MTGDRKRLLSFILLCAAALALFEAWVFTRPPALRIKALRLHLTIFISGFMLFSIFYIWRRLNVLIRTNHLLSPGTIFKFAVLVLMIMAQLAAILFVLMVRTEPHVVSVISSFCFGSILLMTICMITGDVVSFLCRKLFCTMSNRNPKLPKVEMKIRILLSLIGALILIVTGSYCVRNLTVERIAVPIKGLDPRHNGTTITQISDIHLGAFNGKSRLEGIVRKVNGLGGDIVVITGDLVDGSVSSLKEAVRPLKNLRTKYGVFYVTGKLEKSTIYTGQMS